MSLESGTVPATFKHAVITPLLKKPNLDPYLMSNYRPTPNLYFVSKLLERSSTTSPASRQQRFIEIFQSAHPQRHNTETALVRIQNDHINSVDRKNGVLTVLLDMNAAFDTVYLSFIINRADALNYSRTYRTGHIQCALAVATRPGRWLQASHKDICWAQFFSPLTRWQFMLS